MFSASINELQSQIQYHQEQQELAEQELDRLKMTEAFAEDAVEKVEEALEHIDPKYLEVFKEHLLSLFPKETLIYLEEKIEEDLDEIEYLEEGDPDYKSIEQLQQEDPDTFVAVFYSEEQLKEQNIKHSSPKNEESKKSYFELTGRPDLRPTQYDDLAPNITYSSDGRAYIGFDDRQEAEKFRESLDIPSLLDEAQIMNNHKWEVKFYCDRQYLEQLQEELENDWTSAQLAELDWQEQLIRTANDIFYDPSSSKCYVGFSAKGRADSYGSYLTRILDIAEKYVVSSKPTVTTNTKYELVLEQIELDSAQHLSNFNLKKEYDDSKNKDARELWRTTRQRKHEPACKPLPKLVPLDEIKLGDIVYLNSIDNQYKVLSKVELDGTPHIEVICVYNSERPSLVSAMSYLKECYLVPTDSIQIDHQFHKEEEEEVLTEGVQIYVPKEKPTVKKSEVLTENDFPSYPYSLADLSELEPADIITSTPYSRSFYEIRSVGKETVEAVCLFHKSLKGRIGETFTFTTPYLVEKCG